MLVGYPNRSVVGDGKEGVLAEVEEAERQAHSVEFPACRGSVPLILIGSPFETKRPTFAFYYTRRFLDARCKQRQREKENTHKHIFLICSSGVCVCFPAGDVPLPERLHGQGCRHGAWRNGADAQLLGVLRGGVYDAAPHQVSLLPTLGFAG